MLGYKYSSFIIRLINKFFTKKLPCSYFSFFKMMTSTKVARFSKLHHYMKFKEKGVAT
jgi:hypothetical protein